MQHGDHAHRRGKLGARGALIAAAAAGVLCLPSAPALAATGPVSPTPVAGTPTLVNTSTATEQIRQLVDCGGTMYAVGTFTQISGWDGTKTRAFARNNAFSFSDTPPFTITSWDPNVNGTVNSIAFSGGTCADAYLGGQFTSVGGTTVANLAEVTTASTGSVVPGFGSHTGGGHVDTILGFKTPGLSGAWHLLVGGTFTSVNGNKGANPYYASLNPTTGADDGFLHLSVSGHITFTGVKNNSTEVYNQQLSHGGTLLLVEGDFTSVSGQNRRQIFMLDVSGATATLTGWSSPEFDGSNPTQYPYYNCAASHPFYIHAAAWSPGDTEIYIADTGFHPYNWSPTTGPYPIPGLCDGAAAFPAAQSEVTHDWIASDGCDSLYSAAADSSAVYVGGHNRWFNNSMACNKAGTGAIPAPGLAGLYPTGSTVGTPGTLIKNSAGTAGLYSRSRGNGADDMLLTSAGLWIASDTFGGGEQCGGQAGFAGICFLPYQG
jgi:hypothetical protein